MVLDRFGARSRVAALAAAAVLVLTPVAAGCSDDDGGDSGTTQTPTQTQPTNQPANPVAAKAEITKNWTAFFDPKTPVAEKVRVLENGEQMQPVLVAFANDPNAAKSSAAVRAISFTAVDKADVTYDLLIGGQPAIPNAKGTSVEQDGVWKVSVQTLCALVKQSGNAAVPGC
ncbi:MULTISPECIES: hypothetical protein [Streptomyces]|uniref:Low molecular weight antigen MTB12-like C-terminal domain-containing protein n=1 Tax=Streptomyces solicathayae TaxID=3081768 RepID=A0ABZ0M104_9ACTN|nr:hypothetical protein [Streptomyces sp. HUAS YS2]WOX25235.1 hypothetical protein R2D22_29215 [Streptomyces sp. HUAS YS2]